MNFLQNKKEQQRKSSYGPSDAVGTSSEEGYVIASKKSHFFGRYSAGSVDSDGGRKWSLTHETALVTGSVGQAASDQTGENLYQNFETGSNIDVLSAKSKDPTYMISAMNQSSDLNHHLLKALKVNSIPDSGPSIPQILHLISTGTEERPAESKRGALQQLVEAAITSDHSIWTKYFNQILTVVLEVLDDFDCSIWELSLSLIIEKLNDQKAAMEDSIEIIIEKLLHVTKDLVPQVANESEHCLSIVLSLYDPFRCLSAV